MVEKNKILANLKEGLLIENQSWNLKWGTPLTELIPFCETSSVNSHNLPWLNFGPLTILDGIELNPERNTVYHLNLYQIHGIP